VARTRALLASTAVLLLAGTGFAACGTDSASNADSPSTVKAAGLSPTDAVSGVQADFVAVVNAVRPSVVEITTPTALGSGVVYDDNGDIVTNDHVVGTSRTFQVTFFDGRVQTATLVGAFPPDDLAVIHVGQPHGLHPAAFADSRQVQVGDIDMAIGNPLGLASSVTEGIISFTGRTVSESNGVVLPDTIQTSAPINPGNSGGALVNTQGQVIGIPTLAAIDRELGGSAANGIGFAIPSNTVKLVAAQLIRSGQVVDPDRAALGISGATALDPAGNPIGVIVSSVEPGGPAQRAGITPDDVIIMINGQPTPTLSVLQDILAGLKAGARVSLTVLQPNGTTRKVTVTLSRLTG
jgi:S1-C subfamily serine protease